MLQSYTFTDKGIIEVKFEEIKPNTLTFVRSMSPTEVEQEGIAKFLKIPLEDIKEFVEDVEEGARPRIIEEDYFMLLFKAPFHEEDDDIVTTTIAIIIKGGKIVILQKDPVKSLEYIMKMMKENKLNFLYKKSVGYFLYYVIDKINDEFLYILNKIADSSELLKERTKDFSKKEIEKLDSLNTTLIHFNRAILGNAEMLTLLRKGFFRGFRRFDKDKFNELYFDVMQLLDTERIQRNVITGFFNFQNALSSYKLNQSIKRVTSLALIIMVPTLITGMYGMNFSYLPFAEMKHGFFVITGCMVIIMFILLWFFNKLDWV